MASSSENSGLYHIGSKALEKQGHQLRCINKLCNYGDNLVTVEESMCTHYDVDYKTGKKISMVCCKKCFKHYKYSEIKRREEKCIMDASLLSFDSYTVIDDSLSKEEDEGEEEPKPSTSRVDLPPDEGVKNTINSAIIDYFIKNENPFESQVKIFNDFIDEERNIFLDEGKALDELSSGFEAKIKLLKNKVHCSNQPSITSLVPVDINESREELEEVTMSEEKINKFIQEVKNMPKRAKRFKKKTNKDNIIRDRTVSVVPAYLPLVGPLEYPVVESGQPAYAMKSTLLDPWYKCTIKNIVNEDCVNIIFKNSLKSVKTKQIAYFTLNSVRFPVGCRVIAKFTDPNYEHVDAFYAGIVAEPPKLLNKFRYLIFFDDGYVQYRQHKDIHLIAHRTSLDVVWKDVADNSKDFIKSYLEKYPERRMIDLTNQDSVRASHNYQWHMAKVLEVDASLVKLYFTDFKHSEWIYRGSLRLYDIFEQQRSQKDIQFKKSKPTHFKKSFVNYKSLREEDSHLLAKDLAHKSTKKNSTTPIHKTKICSTNMANAPKVVNLELPKSILNPIKYRKHECNPLCVAWTAYNYDKTRAINMLIIPLHFGFVRYLTIFNTVQTCILYRTPCGITIPNMKQMLKYLDVTKSTMTIDQFNFDSWVNPFAEYNVIKRAQISKDISEGKEFRGIPCVNIFNSTLPPKIDYMTARQPMPGVNINLESEFLCGCDCTDNCQDKSKCACWQMTIEGQKNLPNHYKGSNIGYNYKRLPKRVLTGIYECNKTCKCSSSCLNRVVQNPMSQKLQLFMTEKKGWGIQCLNDIPKGSFICNYVGCLLTETDANERGQQNGDEYFAELDFIEVIEKVKEGYEIDVPSSDSDNEFNTEMNQFESFDEHYPYTSDGRRSEISSKHKRKKLKTKKDDKYVQLNSKLNAQDMKNNPEPSKSVREYFGNNESVYIIDNKTSGNIGRYLNHSCYPNTFVQNVFVDTHDLRFPWVGFFAKCAIRAGTELTWNYSYTIGSVPGKEMKCDCKSFFCIGRLL